MTVDAALSVNADHTLAGKTALVTGASRGIGAAIAAQIVANGGRVALVARSAKHLSEVEEMIRSLHAVGGACYSFVCDLTDPDSVKKMVAGVRARFGNGEQGKPSDKFTGAPDIIVNNAGVFGLEELKSVSVESFSRTLDINLVSPFRLIREFLPDMLERGSGHIINIGSIADRLLMNENGPYSAAKFGLRAMTDVLRSETRGSGVRVGLISPAATDTELWDELLANPQGRSLPPREAMMNPNAVAQAVIYTLLQPQSVNIDELRLSHS